MESDIKISECYLPLGEIGMEIENYAGAVGDFLECQVLQKKHFEAGFEILTKTLQNGSI